jgi:hypothetical protein
MSEHQVIMDLHDRPLCLHKCDVNGVSGKVGTAVSNIDDIPGADGIDGNGDTGVAILNAVKGSMGYILKGLCTFVIH